MWELKPDMSMVERLAFSLREEGRGIHALLWDDIVDLYRVLLITQAVLGDLPLQPFLVSSETTRLDELKDLIQSELGDQISRGRMSGDADGPDPPPHPLWILFLQQAASKQVGPRLNGWRRPLSDPRGTLLVVRNADFIDFQRNAPVLASFIGPRIYDAARMLMLCSDEKLRTMKKTLPAPFDGILRHLPGTLPTAEKLAEWVPFSSSDEY
jgi:hypothetical protein